LTAKKADSQSATFRHTHKQLGTSRPLDNAQRRTMAHMHRPHTSRPSDNTQRRNAVNLQVREARDKLSAERHEKGQLQRIADVKL